MRAISALAATAARGGRRCKGRAHARARPARESVLRYFTITPSAHLGGLLSGGESQRGAAPCLPLQKRLAQPARALAFLRSAVPYGRGPGDAMGKKRKRPAPSRPCPDCDELVPISKKPALLATTCSLRRRRRKKAPEAPKRAAQRRRRSSKGRPRPKRPRSDRRTSHPTPAKSPEGVNGQVHSTSCAWSPTYIQGCWKGSRSTSRRESSSFLVCPDTDAERVYEPPPRRLLCAARRAVRAGTATIAPAAEAGLRDPGGARRAALRRAGALRGRAGTVLLPWSARAASRSAATLRGYGLRESLDMRRRRS